MGGTSHFERDNLSLTRPKYLTVGMASGLEDDELIEHPVWKYAQSTNLGMLGKANVRGFQ